MGRGRDVQEGESRCIQTADSRCCTAETNTTVQQLYPNKHKERHQKHGGNHAPKAFPQQIWTLSL